MAAGRDAPLAAAAAGGGDGELAVNGGDGETEVVVVAVVVAVGGGAAEDDDCCGSEGSLADVSTRDGEGGSRDAVSFDEVGDVVLGSATLGGLKSRTADRANASVGVVGSVA